MEFDVVMYMIMIEGMCKSGKVDDVWMLFCSLGLKGVKVNVKMYMVMIWGLCKKGLLFEVKNLFRKMEEDGNVLNDCIYNIFVRVYF